MERINNMKIRKILCAFAAAGMLLTLTACSNGASSNPSSLQSSSSEKQSSSSSTMSKSSLDEHILNSKITSANSLASQIKLAATEFLVKADTDRQAIKGTENLVVLKCTVDGGKWDISVSGGSDTVQFGSGDKWKWTGDDKDTCFNAYAANYNYDFEQGYAEIYLKGGTVIGVIVVTDGIASDIPEALRDEGIWGKNGTGEINWPSGKMSVGANGVVIGTSPIIAQKQS